MLCLPNFLPWNFTKELLENDYEMIVFQKDPVKLSLYKLSHSYGPQIYQYKGTAQYSVFVYRQANIQMKFSG